MSIRTRLVLLVMAVILATLAVSVWAIVSTYQREKRQFERSLLETAGAFAHLVDAELAKREHVARALAASPNIAAGDDAAFHAQAQAATESLGGWVVLYDDSGQRVNTLRPFGAPLGPRGKVHPRELGGGAYVADLFRGPVADRWLVTVTVGVPGAPGHGVSLVVPPDAIQQVVDRQPLSSGWIVAVMDRAGSVVARRPDPHKWVGQRITDAQRRSLAARHSGAFDVDALDGTPSRAFFSRSDSYGWTFVIAVPQALLSQTAREAATEFAIATSAVIGLAVIAALLVSRRFVAPAIRLQQAALALERGDPVRYRPVGIPELDRPGLTLIAADERLRAAHDVLERRVAQAVDETRQAQDRAAAGQRLEALGRLTGGVAHDVNNLLSIVANNAVLIRRLPPDVPRDSPVDAILRAVDTGRRLTRKLLSFARHRSGQPRTIRLQDWMPTTMSMLRTSIGDNVAVRLAVESDVPCVDVDPTELELALLNLAINANDAMPGGGTLTITVRQDPAEERTVVIDVEDSGSGIDPALLPKVFDPFFTTKESSRGSGLGLSQVYGFSQQSGGTVAIRSAPGRGTIVSLRLPATDKPAAEAVRIEGTALARRRVLYVEDNAEVAAATRDVLSTFGYEVTLAFSADEAQSRIANDRFDIVLSDVAMPGETNGLQLAELLRANDPSLPVVLVSGYTAEAERALRAGFDVLQKPCLPDELAATLERVVTLARMGTSR